MFNIEHFISHVDKTLRVLVPASQNAKPERPSPAKQFNEPILNTAEKKYIAGLMRVNHSGEVCAQALYQGQALTAKLDSVKEEMQKAAIEEIDHLAWCEERLKELKAKPSILNPFWYAGSFILGAAAGLAGDKWSLGFVAETEVQVGAHLQKHLTVLPKQDEKTKAILNQMYEDESQHAETARQHGAKELPFIIKMAMQKISKMMTFT
ncbi:MAG: 2-polyprenyl-3-methyl-6-methoxy-1,4-benzoquinone monooxygenase, partial [Proteobacteria bacterium]|nr:2-polyprenyl-3-methyl-6-methoxy-1,4-benzoquinone monooxygenase [Pseudomonadota bacterium]